MCGILGAIPKIDENPFHKALDTLTHRGPDDTGIWKSGDEIILGHKRLSILDLSEHGHQPMISSNGRFILIFNGEIYNFIEIKEELIKKGYIFKSQSDSEVVLAAYEEWRDACLNKFNGMWALAIWDQKSKKLFLSRDRFGKKPLFYSQIGDRFVFASEMKAIYPFLPEVKPSKDFKQMAKKTLQYESTEKCLVEGIKRFPAGHFGIFQNDRLKLTRYWNTLDHIVSVPDNYDKQVEKFRDLFMDACKIRMRSDVPIGTALSGGLDSSATISTMATIDRKKIGNRISKDWQHAFVAAFPGTPLDESKYAQKVVDHIGINATYINIDPVKHLEKLEEYLYQFEELYLTPPIPMIETYHAIKKHGVSVSLDGHGADELFSGYENSIFEAFSDVGINIEKIKSLYQVFDNMTPQNDSQFKKHKPVIYYYLSYFTKKLIKKLLDINQISSAYSKHSNYRKLDNLTKHLYLLTHETYLPTLLRNYDRYSMINSVEIRMPFMDHRVVSYAMSLPWSSKIRSNYTKRIIRDALCTFMPDEVAFRKTKIGFNSPIVDWMKGPMRDFFLDHIASQNFKECGLIDPKSVKTKIENVIFNEAFLFINAESAWSAFTPYLWEQSLKQRLRFRK